MAEGALRAGAHPSGWQGSTRILSRRFLAPAVFELELERPAEFRFLPGQRLRLRREGCDRDYSIASGPGEPGLRLLIRLFPEGRMSPWLAAAAPGTAIEGSGPHGYFLFDPAGGTPVFVAAGTGVAPFRSMAAAGAAGFVLFQGARTEAELFYRSLLEPRAGRYLGCLTRERPPRPAGTRAGRVIDALREDLPPGSYDFYLCGRGEMIRDALQVIDARFPGARVFTEAFS
ncbi:MAG: FAD-binding oxidoreductase [Desulfobacterales bacterium]